MKRQLWNKIIAIGMTAGVLTTTFSLDSFAEDHFIKGDENT